MGNHQTDSSIEEVRLSAEQGNAGAQIDLGHMYILGRGVEKDYAEAVRWFRLAADQGDAEAQHLLSQMYSRGAGGVPQDFTEAACWHQLAAEQGFSPAQLELGHRFFVGDGVHKDYVKAYAWIKLALSEGPMLATTEGPNGEGFDWSENIITMLAEVMTPAQIAEAEYLARQWNDASSALGGKADPVLYEMVDPGQEWEIQNQHLPAPGF